MPLTESQLLALETTERIASCFSVVGTIFIFITFVSSSKFRRPINRLVFYASWGNTICNIATLMSRSPIGYGADSHLCQFQAFLIEMFVPADAFWNLAMAFNVYLTLFRKFNAAQLKSLEWRYLLLCYGLPFLTAFILLFPSNAFRGKIYGDAVLWCWISSEWDFLRVALCYGPAWCCILASMTIYVWAGREIFVKRHQLRVFRNHAVGGANGHRGDGAYKSAGKGPAGPSDQGSSSSDDSTIAGSGSNSGNNDDPNINNHALSPNYKTTDVEITSTMVPLENIANVVLPGMDVMGNHDPRGAMGAGIRTESTMSGKVYEQYSVNIGAQPMGSPRLPWPTKSGPGMGGTEEQAKARKSRAAMEANRAAWGYTKVALLFFVSLLVTWVPSSVNRVYALAHPNASNVPLAFAAGIVLSLMGFWNSVIYIVTSRAACKELFYSIVLGARSALGRERGRGQDSKSGSGRGGSTLGHRPSIMKPRLSWGDDWERLHGSEGRGAAGGGMEMGMGREEV